MPGDTRPDPTDYARQLALWLLGLLALVLFAAVNALVSRWLGPQPLPPPPVPPVLVVGPEGQGVKVTVVRPE